MAVYQRSLSRVLTRLASQEARRVQRHMGLIGSTAKASGGSYDETDVTENAIDAPNFALSYTNLGLNLLGRDFFRNVTNEVLDHNQEIRDKGVIVVAENREQTTTDVAEVTDAATLEAEIEQLPAPAMG